jgi:hypothetical protein
MNNAPFGALSNLYHRPRQPMQGGMQQPMQGGMQQRPQGFPQAAMGQLMGQMIGMPQQQRQRPMQSGGSPMDAIIAQLMQRGR